ncbi:hypothetical protein Q0590_11210 [Rhodocytophaga aerolata]|uniref:Uncharacterized protein n=1 Tax=Rhodocytophaga aerolata TaxID=455078 RepID=A0ABT8R3Z8_9BACT|nr:hypothetical protein [Rhodocytophaga aerolata]MDO1446825.1 hypothetical protein [Rhodocytophaga aerolata]
MKNVHTYLFATVLSLCCISTGYSQASIAKETKILEQQLNVFSAANKKQGGQEKFEFDGCSCKYTNRSSNSDGFSMSKSNEFELKEVSSINYAKNDNNTYELRIKLKTDDNPVTQLVDLSSITINLNTSDEKQVQDISNRFKKAVKACGSN